MTTAASASSKPNERLASSLRPIEWLSRSTALYNVPHDETSCGGRMTKTPLTSAIVRPATPEPLISNPHRQSKLIPILIGVIRDSDPKVESAHSDHRAFA